MPSRPSPAIDHRLDTRIRTYSLKSWNGFQAVYGLQQLSSLAPVYAAELREIYGRHGVGDARRIWGVIADLCATITGLPATMETLIELGFADAAEVGHLIDLGGEFALRDHPILKPLDLTSADSGDLEPVLLHAVAHDRVAKPLLELFRDETHAYDFEAMSARGEGRQQSFSDLVHGLGDVPTAFPWWDGRPMFLDEQHAFLEYLARRVGSEIVAENLVDEELGMLLLYMSGHVVRSEVTGGAILNSALVPHGLLGRPVGVLCHQVGNAVLESLKSARAVTDVFERVHLVERAVLNDFDIDIGKSMESTRAIATDRALREYLDVIDLREHRDLPEVELYQFPEFFRD